MLRKFQPNFWHYVKKIEAQAKKSFSDNKNYTEPSLSASRKETRDKDDNIENKTDWQCKIYDHRSVKSNW